MAVVFALSALVFMIAASSLPAPTFEAVTPTPTLDMPIVVTGPAGDTNGIALLGILIFAVIVIAIVIHVRGARAT